jgi:outer membrane protein assembly factor BamB
MQIAFLTILLAAQTIEISGEEIFTESLTSRSDGTVIVGSATRTIYRALHGESNAKPWIELPASSPRSVFGVLAHEASNTLWACTGTLGTVDPPPPPGTLYAFDLTAGTLRGAYPLPNADAVCNDIAVADDGSVYATDSPNMLVVRLAPGASKLEVWAAGVFGNKGDVIDGIAIVGNRVIVNTLITGKLFAVDVAQGGKAGKVTELALSEPISRPDGMRAIGSSRILLGESVAKGRVLYVDIAGDRATITPIDSDLPKGAVAVTASGDKMWALDPNFSAEGKTRRFRAVRVQ